MFLHREDGPAVTEYYCTGQVYKEMYYLNDIQHRLDGPAVIFHDTNGKTDFKSYFVLGKEFTEKDFYTPGFVDAFILEHS
jgi:hypothetical protein